MLEWSLRTWERRSETCPPSPLEALLVSPLDRDGAPVVDSMLARGPAAQKGAGDGNSSVKPLFCRVFACLSSALLSSKREPRRWSAWPPLRQVA